MFNHFQMTAILTISWFFCLSFLLNHQHCCVLLSWSNHLIVSLLNIHSYSPVVRRLEDCKCHCFICLLFLFILWLGLFPLARNWFLLLLTFGFFLYFIFGLFSSSFLFRFYYIFNNLLIFWLNLQTWAIFLDSFNNKPDNHHYRLNQMMNSSQKEDR